MSEPTRYEILAEHPDGRKYLIGYTPRLSRVGLLNAMRARGDDLVAKLPIGENDVMRFETKPRVHCTTSGWRIGFTGRTQRDARSMGEVQFIAGGS